MLKSRRMIIAVTAAILAVVAVSCAQIVSDPSENFAKESFDAWVKKYDPVAEKKPSGIYMRFIQRNSQWDNLPAPQINKSWLSIEYTGRTLGHNIFETRNSYLSQLVGSWAATTHFVSDYLLYAESQKLCAGLIDALSYMRNGDSVRVYIPASLAYNSSMNVNSGYAGVSVAYNNFPVYFDIRIHDINEDPKQRELNYLRQYVRDHGFDPIIDSIDQGLYMKIIDPYPSGDTITKDSTVQFWHANYFLDNQLVMTNVDTIARRAGYYSSTGDYKSKTLSNANFTTTTGTYLVYPKVVLKMRKGEIAEALSVSWWGPGMSGDITAKPQILPYESLRYMIEVVDTSRKKKVEDLIPNL